MSNEFMSQAIELAVDNVRAGRGGPFGSVVVQDGKVVATGVNQVTSTNDPTAHAEIVAIRAACKALHSFQLTGCDIYSSCEPCPMCLGAIYWARPARVFFACTYAEAAAIGFDDSFIYQEFRAPREKRRMPLIPLMHDEGQRAFRAWVEKLDRVPY